MVSAGRSSPRGRVLASGLSTGFLKAPTSARRITSKELCPADVYMVNYHLLVGYALGHVRNVLPQKRFPAPSACSARTRASRRWLRLFDSTARLLQVAHPSCGLRRPVARRDVGTPLVLLASLRKNDLNPPSATGT